MTQSHWRVPQTSVQAIWGRMSVRVQEAMDRSEEFNAKDVLEYLLSGEWQMWVSYDRDTQAFDCFVLTTVKKYPKCSAVVIMACEGSDRGKWTDQLNVIEEWAAYLGCDRVKAIARPGWERVLKDYRKTHVYLEKKICPVQSLQAKQ